MFNLSVVSSFARSLGIAVSKNLPTILTFVGAGSVVMTAGLAIVETPKAMRILEKEGLIEPIFDEDNNEIGYKKTGTNWDILGKAAPVYLPMVISAVSGVVCIVSANQINLRRNAALASLYAMSEKAYKEYREKTKDVLGERKELKLRDDIHSDYVRQYPPIEEDIAFTGFGNQLCLDSMSGRYFYSCRESIRRAFNDANFQMCSEMFISLNELYDHLELKHIDLGEELGFHIDQGPLDPDFSSCLTDDGRPCLVVDYKTNVKARNLYGL